MPRQKARKGPGGLREALACVVQRERKRDTEPSEEPSVPPEVLLSGGWQGRVLSRRVTWSDFIYFYFLNHWQLFGGWTGRKGD